MKNITDIHSHINYQVDDGSDSIETSIQMLKKEYEQGVENVILTPHFHLGECMPKSETVKAHFEVLLDKMADIIPGMKLYLGNEIMWCSEAVQMLDAGQLYTLADTKYVLIEFYPTVQYSEMEKAISLLLNYGYIPIVAHCERYQCLRTAFKIINEGHIRHLIDMGAYMQVNVTSVFGKENRFVSKLINKDLLHFVASDAHGLETRSVHWDKCLRYLEKKYNNEYIKWLLIENPQKVLTGEYV